MKYLCTAIKLLDHPPSTFLDDQANEYENFDCCVTTKEDEYILKLLTEKSDVDLHVIRLKSLKILYY